MALGSVLSVVAPLTALFAFGLGRDPAAVDSALIGRAAPGFELPMLGGPGSLSLSGLRGQVVVVNFFASWCAACRREHPSLAAAWERYRDQGVVLIGVSYQDRASASREFSRELGTDWPLVFDGTGAAALAYGVYGVPETFVIGRDGRVAFGQVGPVSYDTLTGQITRMQREGAP